MTDRVGDEQAFAGLVRDIESEMATRTRGQHRPLPWVGTLAAGSVGLAVILGVLGLAGSPAIYACAIIVVIALLVGLVRVVVFDWLAGTPETEETDLAADGRR